MTKQVYTNISKPLYELICNEKKRLQGIENKKKRGVKKKRITMITASQSLMRKLR